MGAKLDDIEFRKRNFQPGPGNYDYEMPVGNLLKPTYNVAIAEQCRELVF